ncbi:DNA mismatch repair endonuclease MutL [Psychromonas sp. RZ22]|uniref:DNA mismatch repair endonuclease MutL n=1 Tax=Psychromonas algarum TaxID=2555643 RepID=UPI0010685E98|nr:DNA mismatch repair endonuclease MutL [Psychromonas sp. RZ22]TEW56967.1 DNA mismatch repair endonuclease MutL [Psychromonas sp. RZ22]
MSIKILPARLANQIAAGEVVERPASVVKELVENSLDAGATRIDIEIEQGGAKCIRIKDNGNGVSKEELTLALSRHATSKIAHLDDLEAIVSLGFRGEALASVSSVARLTFTSKPAAQEQAWQAIAEGRDMQVNVQPAAHPQGTTVEVLDLFFNTPARRRFLKTEKTEFQHIDELIKRIALSRFDIAISLKHNNKVVRQYRAAPEQAQQEKRIASICSEQFIQHAVYFEHADSALKISGWVSDRLSPRALADVQYCYINGRMIRDKLVNHAIKQVYAHLLPQGMFPGYIIYIECDAKEVDVNVHPAKHEVRFHQARWVHDFISSTLNTTLNDSSLLNHQIDNTQGHNSIRVTEHAYQPPQIDDLHHQVSKDSHVSGTAQKQSPLEKASPNNRNGGGYKAGLSEQQVNAYCGFIKEASQQPIESSHGYKAELNKPVNTSAANILTLINEDYVLIQALSSVLMSLSDNGLLLMSLKEANRLIVSNHLYSAWQDGEVITQPLLLPVRFKAAPTMQKIAQKTCQLLNRLGFIYKFQSQFIIISQVPAYFRHAPIAVILPQLFDYLSTTTIDDNDDKTVKLLCSQLGLLLSTSQTEKTSSIMDIELLLTSVSQLSVEQLQQCFKQPDLSLLIQGIH